MYIGNICIDNGVFLAPMAGITDSVFRKIAKQYGCVVVYTEMVSSRGILNMQKRTLELLEFTDAERPIGAQIFGTEPDVMGESARYIEQLGFDFIDINMGCPAPKITKRGAGAYLLNDLKKCESIFKEIVKSTSLPVTVKTRAGWKRNSTVAPELAKIAENCGLAAFTLHPRYGVDSFKNTADLEIIRETQDKVSIPVIGNGDIASEEDAKTMFEKTKCKAIMVGRAILGNPWKIKQIHGYFDKTCDYIAPGKKEILTILLQHTKMTIGKYGEKRGLKKMRKHFVWYIKSFPHAKKLKMELLRIDSYDEIVELINPMIV
ncbi:tRNA dihydrouridine synthase DusB [bacterium]|nr:tRNA dihydrouridine synthase DusB [bacterium]